MTWKEVKELVNSLDENQLNSKVIIWGDERGFKVDGIYLLEEDHINTSGDGYEPISSYKDDPDFLLYEDEPRLKKGHPIIEIDRPDA